MSLYAANHLIDCQSLSFTALPPTPDDRPTPPPRLMLPLLLLLRIAVIQIAVPIELRHRGSVAHPQIAQMGKSHFKVCIFGL